MYLLAAAERIARKDASLFRVVPGGGPHFRPTKNFKKWGVFCCCSVPLTF